MQSSTPPAVREIDRDRLQANLEAIASAITARVDPRLIVMLKAIGLGDLRSSISATCSDLASLPDDDLCALFDLIEREVTGVRHGTTPRAVLEREQEALRHALRILGA